MGIFTLLISATVANYRSGNSQSQLRLAAQELATNIRLAQSYAIGSKEFADPNQPSQPAQSPRGGWGIYLSLTDPHSYKIVADLGGDHLWASSSDGLLRNVNLPDNIIIDEIIDNTGSVTESDIFFWPPEPQTFINNSSSNNIIISLKDQLTTTTDRVKVNFFGLVEVE